MLPVNRGTYILILDLKLPSRQMIGRLGTFDFPAGVYAYVGSAFGPGGLRGRLKHHLTPVTKPHWHIDYLRQTARVEAVWYLASEIVYEHEWADRLCVTSNASVPVPHFGASDCKCKTHLIHLPNTPNFAIFCETFGNLILYEP